jgi:hypothetical protein
MTNSRRLDYRNVEKRHAWLTRRRVTACAAVATAVGAVMFVGDSLRRSAAQLGATATTTIEEIRIAPVPQLEPPEAAPLEAATPDEREAAAGVYAEAEPSELEDSPAAVARGPIAADEFAELVEAGVLRDVGADPEATAELRRTLEAAAAEAER